MSKFSCLGHTKTYSVIEAKYRVAIVIVIGEMLMTGAMLNIVVTIAILMGVFVSAAPLLVTYMVMKGDTVTGNKLSAQGLAVYVFNAVAVGLGGGTIIGAVINLAITNLTKVAQGNAPLFAAGGAGVVYAWMAIFTVIFIGLFLKAAKTH